MTPLKADLHIHTAEDPEDLIFYSATELIDRAASLGYQVLSITNHNSSVYSSYLGSYAAERGIVLIPGMEATIEGRHVLLYNMDFPQVDRGSIQGLRSLKRPDTLVMAPHPFFPSMVALGRRFLENMEIFDAVELCHLYTKYFDFNAKAQRLAETRGLPIVGTSDAHQRAQFHTTYSLIEAEPHPEAIIEAVKQGRVSVVTRPLTLPRVLAITGKMAWRNEILQRIQGRRWIR